MTAYKERQHTTIEKEGNTNTNWNKSIKKENLKLEWQKSQNKSQRTKKSELDCCWVSVSVCVCAAIGWGAHKTQKQNKTNFNHNSSIKTNKSTIYAIHLEREHRQWWRRQQRHQCNTAHKIYTFYQVATENESEWMSAQAWKKQRERGERQNKNRKNIDQIDWNGFMKEMAAKTITAAAAAAAVTFSQANMHLAKLTWALVREYRKLHGLKCTLRSCCHCYWCCCCCCCVLRKSKLRWSEKYVVLSQWMLKPERNEWTKRVRGMACGRAGGWRAST